MAEDKYRIDPNITSKIMDSKSVNYGHAISKMFDDLGGIELKKEENAQKQEDRALDKQVKEISVQKIKDEVEDQKQFMNFAKSGQTVDEYTKSGGSFRTPQYFTLAKDFSDKEKQLLDEDAATYNYAEATKRFYNPETQSFDENGFYTHMDTKLKNGEINSRVYASVIDGVNKARKGGIYTETTDPFKNMTPEYKNYYLSQQDPEFKKQLDSIQVNKTSAKSEFLTLTNKLKDPNLSDADREMITDRISKLTNPDMTAIAKDLNTEEKYTKQFVTGLQKDDRFKDINIDSIMEIDMASLTPSQKAQAERLANIKLRAQKPAAAAEITKRMLDVGVQQQQLNDTVAVTLKYMKDGKDFNMVDKAVRENISNYTGLSDKELENSWRDARFQEALNIQLKIQSGTAVSAQEWERFKSAIGTLYQTNKRVALGMLSMATNMKSQVGVLANSMGGEAFHLKYGHIVGNINKMENELQGALFGDKDAQGGQKKVTRIIGAQPQQTQPQQQPQQRQVIKTGTHNGKKVFQYSDGSVEYAD